MEKQFTVNKKGEYYNLKYLGYQPHSVRYEIRFWNNTYCTSREETEKLIEAILKLEQGIELRLKERNLDYNPKKIISMLVRMLQPVLIGIDVRAKWSFNEKVDLFIDWFHYKYKEADDFCKTIYETVVEYNTVESENWRIYEDYDDKRDIFQLPYGDLKEHFGLSTFNMLLESITDFDIKYKLLTDKMGSYER